jgi:hypothetical protein
MVTQVIDPNKPPCIMLSEDELDAVRAQITAGELPRDWFDRYRESLARTVFGHDAKQDRDGNWLEQGLGAKNNETANHFAALKKAEAMGLELPGTYDKALADIWKRDAKRAMTLRLPRQ